jgi:hypothetical protein
LFVFRIGNRHADMRYHSFFAVLYAIGSVRVELETASLFLILFLIFPLALSLTCFLMWTIISLNGQSQEYLTLVLKCIQY